MAVHVPVVIELLHLQQTYVLQQREMTKLCFVWRLGTTTVAFKI